MFKSKVLLVIYSKWVSCTGPNQYAPCSASQKPFKFTVQTPYGKQQYWHTFIWCPWPLQTSLTWSAWLFIDQMSFILVFALIFSHSWWIGIQNDNNSHTPLLIFGFLSSIWGDSPQLFFSISQSECTSWFRETLFNVTVADQVALSRCEPVRKWKCASESCKMASGESVTEGEVLRCMFTN